MGRGNAPYCSGYHEIFVCNYCGLVLNDVTQTKAKVKIFKKLHTKVCFDKLEDKTPKFSNEYFNDLLRKTSNPKLNMLLK